MVFLFFGEDTFLLSKKVKSWTDKFSVEFGDFNISQLEGAELTYEEYIKAVSTLPFLGEKRLILIKNLLIENKDKSIKEKIAGSLSNIPKTSTVIFIEHGVPDQRSILFKALNKPKTAQRFDPAAQNSLGAWIIEKCRGEQVKIAPAIAAKLGSMVGSDLWRLENELTKLILFVKASGRSELSLDDLERLVRSEGSSTIFQLIDSILEKNSKKAFSALYELREQGEDDFFIFSMIVYQFRNLFSVCDLVGRGLTNQEIIKESKLKPFIINKLKGSLRGYDRDKLRKIYASLYDCDRKIKTGQLESSLAIDLLISRVCQGSFSFAIE